MELCSIGKEMICLDRTLFAVTTQMLEERRKKKTFKCTLYIASQTVFYSLLSFSIVCNGYQFI